MTSHVQSLTGGREARDDVDMLPFGRFQEDSHEERNGCVSPNVSSLRFGLGVGCYREWGLFKGQSFVERGRSLSRASECRDQCGQVH